VAVSSVPAVCLLEQVLRPVAEAAGLDLEDVTVAPVGRRRLLRVVVDKDGGVTLDDLAEATRLVSAALDSSAAMDGSSYTLEVSSPGTQRPLTRPVHWRRNLGRLVRVTWPDGSALTGRVVEVDDTGAVIEADGARRLVAYADGGTARVQAEITKPGRHSTPAGEG
jgi:ribosome maturation factor RimP